MLANLSSEALKELGRNRYNEQIPTGSPLLKATAKIVTSILILGFDCEQLF